MSKIHHQVLRMVVSRIFYQEVYMAVRKLPHNDIAIGALLREVDPDRVLKPGNAYGSRETIKCCSTGTGT